MQRARAAMDANKPAKEIAKAAVKDALEDAGDDAKEKKSLARDIYKEATGRFPTESGDRKTVYGWGFLLAGFAFTIAAISAIVLGLSDKTVPTWMATLATALVSGVIGGLFGYAQQD